MSVADLTFTIVEREWTGPTDVTVNGTPAALISLAELARWRKIEVAARALLVVPGTSPRTPWWVYASIGADWQCIGCGESALNLVAEIQHAPDCAAMALDTALAEPTP